MRTGEAPPAADARAGGLEQQLREAREHQAALADVLAAISTVSSDAAPVFETIVRQAVRLCSADYAVLWRADGGSGVCEASFGSDPRVPKVGDRAEPERMLPARRIISGEDLVHIPDLSREPDRTSAGTTFPTRLGVAIRIDGDLWGWMNLVRATVRPFGDREIDLVRTFAQQAGLALKNVRLFNETKEALEHRSAVAEVLRTISGSVFDLSKVLSTLVEQARRLSGADWACMYRKEGEDYRLLATDGRPPGLPPRQAFRRPHPAAIVGRVFLERATAHVPDLLANPAFVELADTQDPALRTFRDWLIGTGFRTELGVPLLREGELLGVLVLARYSVRPFTDREVAVVETFADQAVIAIENVRLFSETKEALERQTATGEILTAIAGSPTDEQPVLDEIARNAVRFCGAEDATVLLAEAGLYHVAAHEGPLFVERGSDWPVDERSVTGRSMMRRELVHLPDVTTAKDEFPISWEFAQRTGQRAMVAAPLLSGGRPIGAIQLRRREARPFSERELELLRTFADQAVIAIENVRLFNETRETLERQTAIGEILRVISESPTDVQPVLDAIASNARRFCAAEDALVMLQEGTELRSAAHAGDISTPPGGFAYPIDRRSMTGRSFLDRETLQVADMLSPEVAAAYPLGHELAKRHGWRTAAVTPLLREGRSIGTINLRRMSVKPFTDRQVDLLRTFASQAVIAIENVRLFNETKESLERQTAISEILRVISSSPTDVQPVLDAIAESAARYCGADEAGIALRREDGKSQVLTATRNGRAQPPELFTTLPRSVTTRAIHEGRLYNVPDMEALGDEFEDGKRYAREHGFRALVAAPLLKDGRAIGAIQLRRDRPGAFAPREVELVRTFAAQAVIALQNVRLFNETKEALEQQTAVASVLDSIARARSDPQPVFDVIVERARELAQVESVQVFVRDATSGDYRPRAFVSPLAEAEFWQRFAAPFRADGPGSRARAVRERLRIHTPDILADASGSESLVAAAHEVGIRSALSIPLVREDDDVIGLLTLQGRRAGAFGPAVISTLETFAAQAVIALENTRLFNETKESLDQQTAIADILRVMTSSPTDTQPIFDAIAQSATKFAAAEDAAVMLVQNDELRTVSHHGPIALPLSVPVGPDSVSGRAVLEVRTVHAADVTASDEFPRSKRVGLEDGQRTVLSAPLVRGGKALGVIVLRRAEARPFTDRQVQLAQTFADQAAIAIENVRLFNETKESLEQQTAVAEVLQVISRSAFDLGPVLDAVTQSAMRLSAADVAWMSLVDDRRFSLVAGAGSETDRLEITRRIVEVGGSFDLDEGSIMSRTLLARGPFRVDDLQADAAMAAASGAARLVSARSIVGVPMIRDGRPIGALIAARKIVRPFTDRQVQLVQTFADQAAIAIENVRLFNEIQQKSQQLEVASRHKSEFLANMSHELRTPLNAIIGFTDVMLQEMFGPLNEKQKEYLGDVRSSGNHLLTLINDILDLSKIEAGRVDLEVAAFSLAEAIDNALTLVRERAARHGIAIASEVAPEVGMIEADQRKVKQILVNLLSNAVKFTPDGGRVGITARCDGEHVDVAVRDTGIGIAADDRTRVFEEFQQVGKDPERSREGTGLGLALAKRYVELHGGRIWVESEVGRGSTFTFTIPVRQTAAVAKG